MSQQDTFKKLSAQEMLCPRCKQVRPVRERLLLVLPGIGTVYELLCVACGEHMGKRTEEDGGTTPSGLIVS